MRTTRSHRAVLLLVGAGMLFAFFLAIAQGPAPEAASDAPSERPEPATPTNNEIETDDAHAMANRLGEARFASSLAASSDEPDRSDSVDRERFVRAVIALRNGRTPAAVEQLESLLDAFGGDRALRARVRANLARAHIRLANEADDGSAAMASAPDGAVRGRDGAVTIGSRDDAAPSRRSAHVRQALALSEEALALAPSSAEAWNVRGLALLAARRSGEAVAAFEKAVAHDPDDLHAQNNLGYVRILRGDHAGAIAPLRAGVDAAERLGIDPPAHLLNNLGVALEATGAFEEAGGAFRAAADAGHPHASVSLARVEERVPRDDRVASAAETLAVR